MRSSLGEDVYSETIGEVCRIALFCLGILCCILVWYVRSPVMAVGNFVASVYVIRNFLLQQDAITKPGNILRG